MLGRRLAFLGWFRLPLRSLCGFFSSFAGGGVGAGAMPRAWRSSTQLHEKKGNTEQRIRTKWSVAENDGDQMFDVLFVKDTLTVPQT
ncbi:hypothetical protein CYLTODRAFT_89601 [Cylindrobasidium torrendii FP15055 ss-10]|uniref:Uncharacterized protein n=1 Tax=Cylindrobasidium torrendii FP15055 ss-10 TaxID=1314674 RepID=A0A0D7B332_9AGAR|nr:hypothetical protein CYLTODRAFT_89601 [Cylindrobasidium torrendii FP15055 ss-10]